MTITSCCVAGWLLPAGNSTITCWVLTTSWGDHFKFVVRLCQAAKALHRGKHVRLLHRKRITELLQPGQIAVHRRQDDRERHQGFHARIPWLGCQCLDQRVAGQ